MVNNTIRYHQPSILFWFYLTSVSIKTIVWCHYYTLVNLTRFHSKSTKWKEKHHLPQKYPTGYWTDVEIECHAVFKLFWITGRQRLRAMVWLDMAWNWLTSHPKRMIRLCVPMASKLWFNMLFAFFVPLTPFCDVFCFNSAALKRTTFSGVLKNGRRCFIGSVMDE